jgi:hypothetical protein
MFWRDPGDQGSVVTCFIWVGHPESVIVGLPVDPQVKLSFAYVHPPRLEFDVKVEVGLIGVIPYRVKMAVVQSVSAAAI